MDIKLQVKFAEKELDEFINKIYLNYKKNPKDTYSFDLTDTEFIGNQELLVLSGLLKSFFESNVEFEIVFFKKGIPTSEINERVKKQIIQFWEVWKIWKIVPIDSYYKYFGIDGNSVERLQKGLGYYPKLSEIYNRHGITPFITLSHINNYNEVDIQTLINPIYKLNSVIEDLLNSNKCYHPFTSSSLSTIITEELYINCLDHSLNSSFSDFPKYAFMSISFQSKLDEDIYDSDEIQKIKKLNFQTECLNEATDFFYDSNEKKYINKPYLQFSFLDFGKGIVETLKEQYSNRVTVESDTEYSESDVLKFAFNHDSSRHPIFKEENKLEQFIPRGLFDVLTLVRRYNGLLVVRSNYGKILFDFSNQNDFQKAFSYFGNNKYFFPGTLISLYIPAIDDIAKLNMSSIKPEITFAKVKPDNRKYISINDLAGKIKVGKDKLYSVLLQELRTNICSQHDHSLVFVSFRGCEIETRLIKKTIYFLLTDYNINHNNNVVILNSPRENIIEEIASEILILNDALKNYKIHPLPIIDFDKNSNDINIKWLGIYDENDKKKLNNLLYEQYSIAKSDFNNPANISGHLNEFDSYGNLISNFPNREDIIAIYRIENEIQITEQVKALLEKYNCIKKDEGKSLYLCNGNYYQKEYIELNNLLNDKKDCKTITELLFNKLKSKIKDIDDFNFIGITTTSHKILKSFESQELITKKKYIIFDNYNTFEKDINEEVIDSEKKYILICDVISTGFLTNRVNARLAQLGTSIEYVGVITSILDRDFLPTKSFLNFFDNKTIFLHNYPIPKFQRTEITSEIFSKKLIRINPHTNIPISLSINETNFNESIIFHSTISFTEQTNEIIIQNKFLDTINRDAIKVGYFKFNSVIHPYFFDTEQIISEFNVELLKDVFKKINNSGFNTDKIQLFYPRKSGIDFFNIGQLKDILKNQSIEYIEIERFGTPEGWRFPHNTDYLSAKIENNFCFILDDGSCSGDSLIQMVDEISFYDAKEIVLLCIIGRVNDHKREFFSRLTQIKVKDGKSIPISIYFLCHWHIPTYYLDENPNTKELNWLNEIINLQNTPQSIKKIANSVIREILPKSDNNFNDYKYLPRIKGTNEIPKKDLLLVREELGKAIGYRLYIESFNFFDSFIKKYENKIKTIDRYKEIELVCATFIYEPYLYDKIVGVLPDVVEKIEEFVRVLIFSNEKIYESLTYKWNKKDIVHLFFIVFKNEKLLKELDESNFNRLIAFTQPKESALNYILYKLLNYIPINESQLSIKKFDKSIKGLLSNLKDGIMMSNKEIRKYYNFITTLPSREDFKSQLGLLIDNYIKQKEPEFHIDKISFDHNISLILAKIRESINDIDEEKPLGNDKIEIIRDRWFEILNFITPILTFSISFNDFLMPFPYFRLINKVENGSSSLRGMVGFNEDVIFVLNESFNDKSKLKLLEKNILRIQTDFKVNSDFHKLISEPQSNLRELTENLYKQINPLSKETNIMGIETIDYKTKIDIPQVYTETLIVNELAKNIKNHSKKEAESKVTIECLSKEMDIIEIRITNTISDLAFNNSNGEGLKCLMLLSDSKLFGFTYKSKTENTKFIQTLTFKIH